MSLCVCCVRVPCCISGNLDAHLSRLFHQMIKMTSSEDFGSTTASGISKVTVILLLNSSSRDPSSSHDPTSQYIVSAFLILLFLISFTANLLLLVTLSSSYSLRRVSLNWLLINLCIVCLSECIFNILIAIYYVSVDTWKLGKTVCSLNAFSTQLVTLQTTLGICILCLERIIASWRPEQFKRLLTIGKQIVAIVILWLAGCLLCVPILAQTIESRLYPDRYGCSLADDNGATYATLMTAWCYALPVVLIFCYVFYAGFYTYKEKRMSRRKQEITYSNLFLQQSYLWSEWLSHSPLVTIVVLYSCFYLPYIFVQQISAICSCYSSKKTSSDVKSTLPEVERTSKLETTFTWFRYIYACLYPLTVFWFRKDIRRKSITIFGCCRSNAVDDLSPPPVKPERRKKKNAELLKRSTAVNISTPVLFATDDGLHLRVLDLGACLNLNAKADDVPSARPRFISYFCDIDEATVEERETILCLDEELDSGLSGFSTESTISTIGDLYVGGKTSPVSILNKDSPVPFITKNGDKPLLTPEPEEKLDEEIDRIIEEVNSPEPKSKPKKCVRFSETITIFRPFSAKSEHAEEEESKWSQVVQPINTKWKQTVSPMEGRQRSRIPVSERTIAMNNSIINPNRIKTASSIAENYRNFKYQRSPL